MFGWFTKRSRNTATAAPPAKPLIPVMREIPARPAVPPGAAARPAVAPVPEPPDPNGSPEPVEASETAGPAASVAAPAASPFSTDSAPILTTLSGHDVVVAATEIARLGDPNAISALMTALRHDDAPVRAEAAEALGALHAETAIHALAEAMWDVDGDVELAARRALRAIGTPAADDAVAAHRRVREQKRRDAIDLAAGALDRSRGAEGLIEGLRSSDLSMQHAAREALVTLGGEAVDPLIPLLEEANPWIRKHAADALGVIGDPAAARPLQRALESLSADDTSFEIRQLRESLERAIDAVNVAGPAGPESDHPAEPVTVPDPMPEASAAPEQAIDSVDVEGQGDRKTDQPVERAIEPVIVADPANSEDQTSDEQLGEQLLTVARAAMGGGTPPLDSYDTRRDVARAIGEALYRRGGIDAMRTALDTHVGNIPGRHSIEQAWDGLGEWMG